MSLLRPLVRLCITALQYDWTWLGKKLVFLRSKEEEKKKLVLKQNGMLLDMTDRCTGDIIHGNISKWHRFL